jgi:hypothetical protein
VGFTPVEWESGNEREKADYSLKSFLFTLKNPHNLSERKFTLKAEDKHRAICCDSKQGPRFGYGSDIRVDGNSTANTMGYTDLDHSYTNDTGLSGEMVLTGSGYFQVKEVEVFEITE